MAPSGPAGLEYMRGRIGDFRGIVGRVLERQDFVTGPDPTIADLSMTGYLVFPTHGSGYDPAASHPVVSTWLARIAVLLRLRGRYV